MELYPGSGPASSTRGLQLRYQYKTVSFKAQSCNATVRVLADEVQKDDTAVVNDLTAVAVRLDSPVEAVVVEQ
ncbi:hypothetical protein ColTof4_11310 [Colletotrichum tofieldiae]|nr:hypothetical protein ColTof3_04497 [Colletotrichum tofieldiae]GKT78887.1 hypothetical protein ColTof4_11310 [Colletotrichum tofieldiae]